MGKERENVNGGGRKLRNLYRHELYSLPNVIGAIKRREIYAQRVARGGYEICLDRRIILRWMFEIQDLRVSSVIPT